MLIIMKWSDIPPSNGYIVTPNPPSTVTYEITHWLFMMTSHPSVYTLSCTLFQTTNMYNPVQN